LELYFLIALSSSPTTDNRSALVVAHTPVGSKYTKHIDVRLMFLKELCRDCKVFDIVFARSLHNHASHYTKATGHKQLFFADVRGVLKGSSIKHHPALMAEAVRFSEMDFCKARAATAEGKEAVLFTYTLAKL
jgi:hypothetical protein